MAPNVLTANGHPSKAYPEELASKRSNGGLNAHRYRWCPWQGPGSAGGSGRSHSNRQNPARERRRQRHLQHLADQQQQAAARQEADDTRWQEHLQAAERRHAAEMQMMETRHGAEEQETERQHAAEKAQFEESSAYNLEQLAASQRNARQLQVGLQQAHAFLAQARQIQEYMYCFVWRCNTPSKHQVQKLGQMAQKEWNA